MAYVKIIHEVKNPAYSNGWTLCFQECVYRYDNGKCETGYRFIWRRPNGHLQAARGQARIPSKQELNSLLLQATQAGWYK